MAAYRTSGVTFDTNSGTKTVTLTPASGDLFVVFVANSDGTGTPTVTDDNGSGTYTEVCVGTKVKRTSADDGFVFIRDALINNTTSTIVSMAPGSTTGGGLAVVAVSGMEKVGAAAELHFGLQSAQSPGGTPAPVMDGAADTDNMLLGFVANATNPAAVTQPSGWSEIHDVGYATPTEGMEVCYRNSGTTLTTITWGGTSATAFYDGVIELDTSITPATFIPYRNPMPPLIAQ